MPEDTFTGSLRHVQAAELLYESRLVPEQEYTFTHALTQEVAYGSLLHERRCTIHAQSSTPSNSVSPTACASRSNRSPTMPSLASCGTKAVRLRPAGRGEGHGALGPP